ncbi:VOC family protein [Metallumcola ferriviriculae]|uniref:VOC family protein n=1 Tax=Metallumcola ferriviriculae TaxID=3039180 RepID=A0AAU0UK47_9FIRM|nr:VOC family protein [Desulfitibacteraceae bacterium MK1]
MFNRIEHAAFMVKDCDASKQFYQEHFGFKVRLEMNSPAPGLKKIIFITLGDTELELIETTEPPKISGCHICLGTDNFDDDFQRLTAADIKVAQQPVPASADRKRAAFHGPDGEEIEIIG